MNRTFQIALAGVLALVLATGCRRYRTRAFVADPHPVKFENWRLYVNAHVDAANPAPTNHFYLISAVAWTAPGDSIGGNPSEFRPTTYDASLDSLRLFRIAGTNAVELPLPPLHHGPADHPNRLVQLYPDNGTGVTIPASVSELRADVVLTFRHRETGKTETKVFTLPMHKRERTKLEPMLECVNLRLPDDCSGQAPWLDMEEGSGVFIRLLQMDHHTAQASGFRKHPPKWTLHVGDEFERSRRCTTHSALQLISRCILISLSQPGRLSIEWIERGGIRWLS